MPEGAEHTAAEMMCVAAARQVLEDEAVLVGMGPPLLAMALAKTLRRPGMWYVTEAGAFDWDPAVSGDAAPYQIADPRLAEGSSMVSDMGEALGGAVMGRWLDCAVLQAAQVDRFGNLNTMIIGPYRSPKRRLPGTGGNSDSGASARRVISTLPLERRRFAERVDFITTAGYISGPGARREAGIPPQGPNLCVTTGAVFAFDTPDGGETGSCEMTLWRTFPGVSVEDVRAVIPWKLRVSGDLGEEPPPTDEELAELRRLDHTREHLAPGRY
ncbi:MAG: CoA-transferase subunit beta [Chloroflexota bacterium]